MVFYGDTNYIGNYSIDFRIQPYAPWIGIKEEKNQSSFSLYPNPSSEIVTITSTTKETFHYSLYSVDGTELIKGEGRIKEDLDISHLPPGFYILQFHSFKPNNFKIIKL